MRRRPRSRYRGVPTTVYWCTDSHMYELVDGNPEAVGATSGNKLFWTGSFRVGAFVAAVNAAVPDLALHTGDAANQGTDDDFFLTHWGGITPTIPNVVCIGNHELIASTYADAVTALGVGARAEVAGSKFNYAFSLSDAPVPVRVITVDPNIDDTATHVVTASGYLQADALAWIASELTNCTENIALVCMHHPTSPPAFFDDADVTALAEAVQGVVNARPGFRVYVLGGHWHDKGWLTPSPSIWAGIGSVTALIAPALADYNEGRYAILHIYRNGRFRYRLVETGLPA